ncbi:MULTISPECIES: KAP family NTPase [unclassified Rhizobium]|uniref:KAP family NTPase n=1 Tax=unclassified Rhizobium TaxID=2613769 RepID=UPI0021F6B688|nr:MULTISPECIES: KAP family NTPase [unclassified Rhizobium]MCV9942081.1 KAP family NTPase [Rhizobium sp. BT-175]MCW0015955.1 KAP family NTPase [Rhizobium sp. BT-226]
MTTKPATRNIIYDEPAGQDMFRGKGHDRTAEALVSAIKRFGGKDRAIGLDGPWGSGKSTVVEIARKKLELEGKKTGVTFSFFAFDIWQSQGSSFRRSFLEHFLDWAKVTFPKEEKPLEEIERKVKGKIRQVQSNNQSILDWWGVIVVVLVPLLPLFYIWAKQVFDEVKPRSAFIWTKPAQLLGALVVIPFLLALWRAVRSSGTWDWSHWRSGLSKYREQLSRVLLISSKQYEDQKVTQYIRETDPNDFEFQSILREILSQIQSEKSRVVLVLDNIDRLPRKEINEYWAQVRAVFSSGPLARKSGSSNPVTAIVPYDRRMIEEGYKEPTSDKKGSAQTDMNIERASISSLASREIFSKTFDEILTVSPPVMSNSREFFMDKISQALPDFTSPDDLFRVYLIFDRILKSEAGYATPRQIISFINELTGIYVLHDRRFKLPTVAVYIAYQDDLEKNPQLVTKSNSIDTRVRAIAADIELDLNLAAMIFNVEPQLALQLLLDDKIREAAAAKSNAELLAISKAPGFDIRVNDVLQDNIEGWRSSKEFGFVLSNFADLVATHDGDSTKHTSKTLVDAFRDSPPISLIEQEYKPLLRIYELAEKDQLPALTANLLAAVSKPSADPTPFTVEHGQNWAAYLGHLKAALSSRSASDVFDGAIGNSSMSRDPRFMFGVAASAGAQGVDFGLKYQRPDVSKEPEVLQSLTTEYPEASRKALEVFYQDRPGHE